MQVLESKLEELLVSLPPRPISQTTLNDLVSQTLAQTPQTSSPDNRRLQWEYGLRNQVFTLAATEGIALKDLTTTSQYYESLRDRLDLVLTFTEKNACDPIFPFNVLYDLLETQTISSCSHIFSWIEERADRLTEGMVPQKGKALILLRTLNDLLKRLSKMGSTTKFCGRILTFLSRVFPLGERSGVNLRGEYGPTWEGPGLVGKTDEVEEKMQVDEQGKVNSPVVDKVSEQRDEFYRTFWSLQLPFSRPPIFAEAQTISQFKEAVNKVMPVIKEATVKERALMGSKTLNAGNSVSLKRKREPETIVESTRKDYFFAKYLTSPDLLELEIADTHFRRQFLFQLLILLHHLLTFTKTAKADWFTSRNRSLQVDFTLDNSDAQWVQETILKANDELKQTSPNGRGFAETVSVILEREKNWIKWKNDLCAPFDKEPWSAQVEEKVVGADGQTKMEKRSVGMEEATRSVRQKMGEDPPQWEHSLGSAPLTEIWDMGYRDLHDLQHPFQPGDVKDFVKKVKQEDARIEMRRKQLIKTAERLAQSRAKAAAAAAAAAQPPSPPKPVVAPEPPSTPRSLAATSTPPLHHPLPAKPGTSPQKPKPTPPPPPPVQQETAPAAVPAPAVVVAPAPEAVVIPHDDQIAKFEENKQRWNWLALRTARDQYLQYLGRIGAGDVVALVKEIEKPKEEKEKEDREKEMEVNGEGAGLVGLGIGVPSGSQGEGGLSPLVVSSVLSADGGESQATTAPAPNSQEDVKMEA